MRKNVGETDKIFRFVLGVVLLSLTIVGPKTMWGLLGIFPLVTALFNFCPLYAMLGMSTCRNIQIRR